MPEKEISNWSQWWLPALTAAWGGMAAYLRQIQGGKTFRFWSMALHLAVSGFAGLMFWLLSVEYSLSGPMTAITTGMAGFMGSEAIKMLEDKIQENLPPLPRPGRGGR